MATQKKSKEIRARVDSENAMRAFAAETGAYEDFKPKVYWDKVAEKWTIGHGFNLDAPGTANYLASKGYNVAALKSGKAQLTKDQSLNLLNDLFVQSYDQARNFVPNFDTLPEKARYVLADMTYNMGYPKLTKFEKMQKALAANDYNEAAAQLKDSNYYKQVGRRSKAHYNELLELRDAVLKASPTPPPSVVPTPLFGVDLNTMQPTIQPGKPGPTTEKASHFGYTNIGIPESDLDRKINDLQWSGTQWIPSNQMAKKYEPTMWENAKQTVKGWLHDFEDSSEETPSTSTPTFKQGGDVPSKYNTIPTGILKRPTIISTTEGSYYSPSEQTIYLNPVDYYNNPSVYQHEMFHHWQNLNDELRKPEEYQGPLAKPNMLTNNTGDYYNRRNVETDEEFKSLYDENPTFKLINPNLIYDAIINRSLYENPKYAEGEAEDYENYAKSEGANMFMHKQGGLIKRADGSYSRRGLWDNIRANRGSGRKPTAEMLRQERKIKKKEDGGLINMYAEGDVVGEDPKPVTTPPPANLFNINDFFITPDEVKLYEQRAKNCHEGDAGCLEQAFNYYDKYVAPNLGMPNSWTIKQNAGISSGSNNPRFKDYEASADSWDIHGLLQEKGATKILAADMNNPNNIEQELSKMSLDQQKDYFRNLRIPIGSVVGMGSKSGTVAGYGNTSYNNKLGLPASRHSGEIIGYDETGLPMMYDYGQIVPITNRTFNTSDYPITNITAPKETAQYTYDYLKANNQLQNDYTPLNLKTNTTEYDEDEYTPFIQALKDNKATYANAFRLTNTEYDELAKKAAALALTETGGGDDATIRWKGIVPIPSYLTDKLGFGDTKGITQINSDMIFNSKELSDKLKTVGITKDNYDPWNPNHISAATIALLKSNVRPAERAYNINTQKLGYDPGLSDAAITYYQWNQPSLLIKGEAKGESEKVKKFQNNYNLIDIGDYLQLNSEGTPSTTLSGVEIVGKKADGGWIDMYNAGSWVEDSSLPQPTTPSFYDAYPDRTLTNYQMGTPKSNLPIRGLRDATPEIPAYREGATVWTKQNTPTWIAGTPTPTATQNFRNDRSLNTDLYRIGDVIPTGMDYKTPAAGTYDYSKDIQPYYTMRLHAPDTTMMARHGGHIKKHVNSPRVYGNPVNPSGMSEGPTLQKGGIMMFADGSTVGYDQAKAQYMAASNRGIMGEKQMQDLVKQFPQLANDSSLASYRSVGNAAMYRNNEEANRVVTTSTGKVLSTPASRKKAQREEIIARRPEVYNVQDYYQFGIPEPGAPNDVTNDPIAMALLGTAISGVGLGTRGAKALATDFAGNLASEATFGGYDLTKGTRNLFNSFKPTSSFKSEINWGKWNSEIPSNKALMDEYHAIEETSKANGTWMKNPDGSVFQGTPEQFVQQNSENFKKAFPEGFTTGYRGAHQHIDDFANRNLNAHTATFLTDSKANAETYATSDGLPKTYYHPEVNVHPAYDPKLKGYPLNYEDGIYQLAFPKNLPKVIGEGRGNNWRFLDYDENIANNINPQHLKNDHEFRVLNLNSPRKNSSINLTYPNDFTIDKKYLTTDNYATYVKNNPIGIAEIKNVSDQMGNVPGILPNTIYAIDANKVPIKSLMYNNGMFDMTNPNIYKGLVPVGIFGASMYGTQGMQQQRNGGYVKNNNSNTWLDYYN